MKPEKQQKAIAEACGFELLSLPQNPNQRAWQRNGVQVELPDYLNDLNAMHEAEKVLTDEQWSEYYNAFNRSYNLKELTYLIHSTAAQRAEAFLKTIGKWEE